MPCRCCSVGVSTCLDVVFRRRLCVSGRRLAKRQWSLDFGLSVVPISPDLQVERVSPGGHGLLKIFLISKCGWEHSLGKEKLPGLENSGAKGHIKILISLKSGQATWSERHNIQRASRPHQVASNLLESKDYTSLFATSLGCDGKFLSLCLVLRPQGSQENSPAGTTA